MPELLLYRPEGGNLDGEAAEDSPNGAKTTYSIYHRGYLECDMMTVL